MRNIFSFHGLLLTITILQDVAIGLTSVTIKGPYAIEEAKSTRLHCHFSIEERREENIYSVVWYWTPSKGYTSSNPVKENEIVSVPFYRFLQNDDPKQKVWTEGLDGAFSVGILGSTRTSVFLDQMSLASEGIFTCEISFTPDFSTFSNSKLLKIGKIPNGTPIIRVINKQKRYQDGDTLDLNCSSTGGYPSPNITWFINSEKIDLYGLKSKDFHITDQSKLSSEIELDTYSLLTIPIQTNILNSGNLKVKCVVSMWNLFHKSNEISVEIQGLDPYPKSIRHLDAKNISTVDKTVDAMQDYDSGELSIALSKLTIISSTLFHLYQSFSVI